MSEVNIVEEIIYPDVPKTISNEMFYVYVPVTAGDYPGIASFDDERFMVINGKVYSKIPMSRGDGFNSVVLDGYNPSDAAQTDGGINVTTGPTSAIFGDSNINEGTSAIVAGSCNTNGEEGGFSIIAGTWNRNANDSYNSILLGHDNTNCARSSIIAGDTNTNSGANACIAGYSNTVISNNSGVLGRNNYVDGRDSLVMGADNKLGYLLQGDVNSVGCALVTGFENVVEGPAGITGGSECHNYHYYGLVCGTNLQTSRNSQAVFGEYNADNDRAHLIVGCGSINNRKNALEVTDSGSVWIGNNLRVAGRIINPIIGESLTVYGSTTTHGTLIVGKDNAINDAGDYSAAIGYRNAVASPRTVAIGTENITDGNAENCLLSGQYLTATSPNQTIFGVYNIADGDALLVVGNGTSNEKNNAFAVKKDGSIQVGNTCITEEDIKMLLALKNLEIYDGEYEVIENG